MTAPQQDAVPFAAAVQASRQTAAGRIASRHWATAAVLLVALAIPFVLQGFIVFQLTEVMIYGLAILGLNLLTGFNGQFSLGHGAFYGLGGYAAAILMHRYHVPYYWTLPAAGGVCFVVGFLFGLPALRLQGLYLALATFALAVALPQILKFPPLEEWTGGVQGLVVEQPEAPPFLPIDDDQWLYYLTLLVVVLMFGAAANLVKSRTGRAIMAIRDHPIAAAAMGINPSLYKTLTFGVSALYTGVAGALGALVVQFVAPDSFGFLLSVSFLVGLIIGGIGSLPGCLFGGLFVLYVPNIAEHLSQGLAGAIYGAIMLIVIFAVPSGAAGYPSLIRHGYYAPTINRSQYFALWLAITAIAWVVDWLAATLTRGVSFGGTILIVVYIAVVLAALGGHFFIAVKRLHDMRRSPSWSWLLLLPGVNLVLCLTLFLANTRTAGQLSERRTT